MFRKFNPRITAEVEKTERQKVAEAAWGRDVIEGKAQIMLPSRYNAGGRDQASATMKAARLGVIKGVIDAAKAAQNKKEFSANIITAYDILMGLLKPLIKRGRNSKGNYTRKLLARQSVIGNIGTADGVTVSLGTIMRAARDQYTKATGSFITTSDTPNFLSHMCVMASYSVFLGDVKDETTTMPGWTIAKLTDGAELLCIFIADTGAVLPLKATYTTEKAGLQTVHRFGSQGKYFFGLPGTMETPITLTAVAEKATVDTDFQVFTTHGGKGVLKVLGMASEDRWPYHPYWLQAKAIPTAVEERAALLVHFWDEEMVSRRSVMASVDVDTANKLKINYEEHTLNWFANTMLPNILTTLPGEAPFLHVPLSEWTSAARALVTLAPEIAMAMVNADDGLSKVENKIEKDVVIQLMRVSFPDILTVQTWKKWLAIKKEVVSAAKAEKKTKIDMPDPADKMTPEEAKAVKDIQRSVASMRAHMRGGSAPTIKAALTAVMAKPLAGAFMGLTQKFPDTREDVAQWATQAEIVHDHDDASHENAYKFLKMVENTTPTEDFEEMSTATEDILTRAAEHARDAEERKAETKTFDAEGNDKTGQDYTFTARAAPNAKDEEKKKAEPATLPVTSLMSTSTPKLPTFTAASSLGLGGWNLGNFSFSPNNGNAPPPPKST